MSKRALRWLALIVIVGLGAWLRLVHLAAVPPWYPDEGSNIAIAASLARGEPGYLVFAQSSFINGHPHLFYLLLAGLFRLSGPTMEAARLLAALCGLSALLLLYPLARALADETVALLALAFYAIYPTAVVYHRMAFTYNLLAPLYLLALYALHRYLDSQRRAGRVAGLAGVTDLVGWGLIGFVALAVLLDRPRHLPIVLPPLLLPLAAWLLWMAMAGGGAFWFDLRFALSRVGGTLAEQVARFVFFYRTALEGELWLALGSIGLLLLPNRRARWLAGGLHFTSLFFVTRTTAAFGQATYFLIPLLPLVALGMGSLLGRGLPFLLRLLGADVSRALEERRLLRRGGRRLAALLTACLVFAMVVAPLLSLLAEGPLLDYALFTARMGGTLADPAAARQVVDYVNSRTGPADVVLASPTIAWLFDSPAADLQMAVAATGRATQHFPADIPPSRFRFDPRLEEATYVVLDPLWRGWGAAQMAEVAQIVETVEAEWTLERTLGSFDVYRNPYRP